MDLRKTPSSQSRKSGFTLVELVIVIIVLGILAAVAVPKFFDFTGDAKEAACKGALGGVRSAIANFYAYSATPAGGGTPTYPTLVQLETSGTVLTTELPDNPYSTASDPNDVGSSTAAIGTANAGTTGAWRYNPATGEFWANTTSGAGEASW